jgi:hypothetical protein
METTESRVAKTVLQQPITVIIGDETFEVAPPSVATLILASEAISQLPAVELNSENIVSETLYVAKDCRALGDVLAIFILGAKGLMKTKKVVTKRFFGLVKDESEVTVDKKAELSEKILSELSPKQVSETLTKLLQGMEVAFFFGSIISLIEINMTRATKMTASGLQ